MSSIMSFPNRGKWGDPLWRGNCSGYVYEALFKQLKPKVFVDPMQGSGTSIEVATEMQIECYGLDLFSGFNAVRDSILGAVGKEADCCISHPPYGSMILYSGAVWGKPHPDDLSRCVSDSDFNEKMQLVLLNQRAATTDGGFYGTIIGDRRQEGRYTSYMAEMIARMPKDELASVIIKAQHNCQSDNKSYGRMKLPLIQHEYIILWQKQKMPVLVLLGRLASQQYSRLQGTWRNIVRSVLVSLGGTADLAKIYEAVAQSAPDKLANTNTWRDKVRQTLNQSPGIFASVERGVWKLA